MIDPLGLDGGLISGPLAYYAINGAFAIATAYYANEAMDDSPESQDSYNEILKMALFFSTKGQINPYLIAEKNADSSSDEGTSCPVGDEEKPDLKKPGTLRNPDGTLKNPADQHDQILQVPDNLANDKTKSKRNVKNWLKDIKNIPLDELDDYID